jgi:hypothetical protein
MKQLLLIVAITLAMTGVSSAQPADSASAGKVPVARRMYEEGLDAFNKGRWSLAYERFKASYDLAPRVATLFNLASSQMNMGKVVEAAENYRRFLRETADGRYPELRTDATNLLESLEKQVAQVTLDITNVDAGDVVAIDDTEFPHAALGEPIPMNPGSHAAKVSRGGAIVATRPITLAPGSAETVRIELPVKKPDLNVHRSTDEPGPPGATFDNRRSDQEPKRSVFRSPWFWSAAAAVVVAGAAGAYFFTRSNEDVVVVK